MFVCMCGIDAEKHIKLNWIHAKYMTGLFQDQDKLSLMEESDGKKFSGKK